MFNNISISQKIHIPLIISLMFGLLIISLISWTNIKDIEKEVYINQYNEVDSYIIDIIDDKRQIALTNALSLSFDDVFIKALRDNRREDALSHGKKIMNNFASSTKFKNVKIHLHTRDVKSFLRVWKPNKFGDDLSSFRHTINDISTNKRPLAAIEVGKVGLSMRGLAPIFNKFNYIGSIELIQGFDSLINDTKKELDSEVIFLLDDKFSKIAKFLDKTKKIENYIVAQKSKFVNESFYEELKSTSLSFENFTKSENYFITKTLLYDFKKNPIGMAVTGRPIKIVDAIINQSVSASITQIVSMFFIDVVILLLLMIIISKSIGKPLKTLIELLKELSSTDGDLTKRINLFSKDELGTIAKYVNEFISKVQLTVTQTKELSSINVGVTHKLSENIKNIETHAHKEVVTVSSTSDSCTRINEELEFSIEQSKNSNVNISNTNETLQDISKSINDLSNVVQVNSEKQLAIATKLQELSNDTDQVKNVLDVISDIAEQTNLLALNAAIEAARAGEHGRGFAVVADEVRHLSSNTTQATQDIQQLIGAIQASSSHALEQVEKSSSVATLSLEKSSAAGEAFEAITSSVDQIRNHATEVSNLSTTQNNLSTDVYSSIASINDAVQRLSDTAKRNVSENGDLSQYSVLLRSIVSNLANAEDTPESVSEAGEAELF